MQLRFAVSSAALHLRLEVFRLQDWQHIQQLLRGAVLAVQPVKGASSASGGAVREAGSACGCREAGDRCAACAHGAIQGRREGLLDAPRSLVP